MAPVDAPVSELRAQLRSGKVVPVVGAGVSRAVADLPGWSDLVARVLDHVELTRCGALTDIAEARRLLANRSPETLIGAAQRARGMLTGVGGPGEFPRWLRDEFDLGLDQVNDHRLVAAIHTLGCPLVATTNYDTLLSRLSPSSLDVVTWQEPSRMQRAIRDGGAVLHLHGVWDRPDSIVVIFRGKWH